MRTVDDAPSSVGDAGVVGSSDRTDPTDPDGIDVREREASGEVGQPEPSDESREPPTFTRAERGASARRARRRRRRRVLFGSLLALVALVVGFTGWFVHEVNGSGAPGKEIAFDVPKGWGVQEIGNALQDRKVIGSSLAFQLYAKATSAGPFEAGHYSLPENLGVREAVTRLEKRPAVKEATLDLGAPGLTLGMVARQVGQLPGRDAQRFLNAATGDLVRSKYEPPDVHNLEGLTWPAKYQVGEKQDEGVILQTLVSHFDTAMDKLGLANATIPNGLSPYQALVVASLIQTEAKLDEDRPLIAAVIYNRLKNNMPLQIDSTLLYARGSRQGAITAADKASDSPYNTYKQAGLPPTPISTLALSSVKAALAPANVPYLYYVVGDASGKHAFATTYEDHLKNVAAAKQKGLVG